MGHSADIGEALEDREILHDSRAPQVEEVLALTSVTCAVALPRADVRAGMLDRDPCAQGGPSCGRQLARAQFGKEALVGMATLRPWVLSVQWVRRGHTAQVWARNGTTAPGVKGIST